jgi:hypothetical protein
LGWVSNPTEGSLTYLKRTHNYRSSFGVESVKPEEEKKMKQTLLYAVASSPPSTITVEKNYFRGKKKKKEIQLNSDL